MTKSFHFKQTKNSKESYAQQKTSVGFVVNEKKKILWSRATFRHSRILFMLEASKVKKNVDSIYRRAGLNVTQFHYFSQKTIEGFGGEFSIGVSWPQDLYAKGDVWTPRMIEWPDSLQKLG